MIVRWYIIVLAVDLGDDFTGRPFITDNIDMPIRSASQLQCNDFARNCRWRAVGHAHEVKSYCL